MATITKIFRNFESLKSSLRGFNTACIRSNNHAYVTSRCYTQKFTTHIPEFESHPHINSYEDLYRHSLKNPDIFWSRLARSRLHWFKDFDITSECDIKNGLNKWFLKGKLNASG